MEFYSDTQIIPAITGNDRSYLWESYLLDEAFPIPEVNDPTNELSSFRRALAFGLRSGSQIEITQKIEVEIVTDNPSKIDTDYRYYQPKQFCGTWQELHDSSVRSNGGGFFDNAAGRNTLINKFNLSVLAEFIPSEFLHFQNQLRGDLVGCNWRLQPDFFPDPLTGTPVAGFSLVPSSAEAPAGLLNIDSRFLWRNQDENYPYGAIGVQGAYREAFSLDNLWYRLGFYFYEGCQGISVRQSLSVDAIEQIVIPATIENSAVVLPSCSTAIDTCDAQWDVFLAANPELYTSQSACESASGLGFCTSDNWQCPTDPTDSRTFWAPVNQ